MQFEVIRAYTGEVEKVFDNEEDAWKWIRGCGDHSDLYDIRYEEYLPEGND